MPAPQTVRASLPGAPRNTAEVSRHLAWEPETKWLTLTAHSPSEVSCLALVHFLWGQ